MPMEQARSSGDGSLSGNSMIPNQGTNVQIQDSPLSGGKLSSRVLELSKRRECDAEERAHPGGGGSLSGNSMIPNQGTNVQIQDSPLSGGKLSSRVLELSKRKECGAGGQAHPGGDGCPSGKLVVLEQGTSAQKQDSPPSGDKSCSRVSEFPERKKCDAGGGELTKVVVDLFRETRWFPIKGRVLKNKAARRAVLDSPQGPSCFPHRGRILKGKMHRLMFLDPVREASWFLSRKYRVLNISETEIDHRIVLDAFQDNRCSPNIR